MDNLTKLAISKALEKDTKNFKATPGVHDIDTTITLRVKGTVKKGADSDYTPTVDIPLLPTLALVLEKALVVSMTIGARRGWLAVQSSSFFPTAGTEETLNSWPRKWSACRVSPTKSCG